MCFLWAAFGWQALETRGLETFGINLAERLMAALKRGVYLNTDYSGMGGPEEALRQVVVQSPSQHGDLSEALVPGRAGDLMPHCRQVCCGHRGKLAPVRVFGNILDRCPPGKKLAMRRALNDYRARRWALVAKCKHKQAQTQKAKQEALIQMGTVFFDKLVN